MVQTKEELRVRLRERVYRVERPFGNLPTGQGSVSDVAVDGQGRVLALLRRDPLLTAPSNAVIALDTDGSPAAAWGSDVADAHMLFCDPASGEVVVVDRDAHELRRYSAQGEFLGGVGGRHRPGEPFGHPTDVARMRTGEWIVTDGYGNAQVHVFAPDWTPLRRFGRLGSAAGEFLSPHSVAALDAERFVVADRENHRLQVLRLDGTVEAVWGDFFRPQSVWTDGAGLIFVTDAIPSLTLLDTRGERLGRCRPVLNGAHGLCGNASTGELYLAEGSPSRLTRLTPIL